MNAKFVYSKPPRVLDEGHRTVSVVRSALTMFLIIIAMINVVAFLFELTGLAITHLVATLLAVYLLFEFRLLLSKTDALGLLSPAILSIPLHFVTSYLVGITSAAFEPTIMTRYEEFVVELDEKLALTLSIALVAAFCMLRGYALALPWATRLRSKLRRMTSLRQNLNPNLMIALGTQVVLIIIIVYSISIGIYGLLSTPEGLEKNKSTIQILKIVMGSGSLGLFLLSIYYFQKRKMEKSSRGSSFFIFTLLIIHILFGALTAYKSQMVVPMAIFTLAHFLVYKKIHLFHIFALFLLLNTAYAVVEPFRGYLAEQSKVPSSFGEAVDALNSSYQNRENINASENARAQQMAERFDISGMTTLAIEFVQKGNLDVSERREFQYAIILAPVLAYVPRFVWQDKPSYSNVGVWFNQVVLGRRTDETTSVGMGPIGYFYFAGGIMAVIVGFAGFGVIQALMFEGVARAGAGGLIVYLSVASTLIDIPAAVGPSISGLLSLLPFAFVAQLLFLRKGRFAAA
jgi:hypothetical protein